MFFPTRTSIDNKNVVLVVTGSVAAIKTVELAETLRKHAYAVEVILTKAPEQYKWVSLEALRQTTGRPALTESDPFEAKEEIIRQAGSLVVVPASADFISQLSFESSDLARTLREAHRGGVPLSVVPAMNYKIWEHPTVQRNCAALVEKGVFFFGPVEGHMACNDYGFGRMMKVDAIVDSLQSLLNGKPEDLFASYELARQAAQAKAVPYRADPKVSILAVIEGADIEWKEIEDFVAAAKAEGLSANYVLDQKEGRYRDALERLTGKPVITDHYQVDGLEGLEHIRLPEEAGYVIYPFLDNALAQHMLKGETGTLGLDIYIASKAPVAAIPSLHGTPEASVLAALSRDNILVIKDLQELKRVQLESQAITSPTPK